MPAGWADEFGAIAGSRGQRLWFRPHDGHVSVLDACPLAMDWLKAHCRTPLPAT